LEQVPPPRPERSNDPDPVGARIQGPQLALRPEECLVPWPCRLFEVDALAGLKWQPAGRSFRLVAEQGTVGQEQPGWWFFGPYGQGVPDLFEEIWSLTPDKVARLPEPPPSRPGDAIEFSRVPATVGPPGGLLERAGSNAAGAIVSFFESRTWSLGTGGRFLLSRLLLHLDRVRAALARGDDPGIQRGLRAHLWADHRPSPHSEGRGRLGQADRLTSPHSCRWWFGGLLVDVPGAACR
jgi:hypothetical protein